MPEYESGLITSTFLMTKGWIISCGRKKIITLFHFTFTVSTHAWDHVIVPSIQTKDQNFPADALSWSSALHFKSTKYLLLANKWSIRHRNKHPKNNCSGFLILNKKIKPLCQDSDFAVSSSIRFCHLTLQIAADPLSIKQHEIQLGVLLCSCALVFSAPDLTCWLMVLF